MLHQAANSGEEYVLLKLDVIKAFDRLEWPFLLTLVDKVGMKGQLSRFSVASFSSASSSVLLNGRETERCVLKRSVRQGDPLSPLMFILAFDVLGDMFTHAIQQRTLLGVDFPRVLSRNFHNFLADDLSAVLRALPSNISEFKQILQRFGTFSGLICAWDQTMLGQLPKNEWNLF